MKVEIAHFYLDQEFNTNMLDHLKSHTFKEEDFLFIFIDDIHVDVNRLDLSALAKLANDVVGRLVVFEYESSMIQYCEIAPQFIDNPTYLHDEHGNELQLLHSGKVLIDYTGIQPQATCQMLSFVWTLYRMGILRENPPADCLTIIHKKYCKLEQRVCSMLKPELKKHAFYRFY